MKSTKTSTEKRELYRLLDDLVSKLFLYGCECLMILVIFYVLMWMCTTKAYGLYG